MTGDALRDQVVQAAREISTGTLAPRAGAARIWSLLSEAGYPPELAEFRVFVGLVSEIEDHPEHAETYIADILEEAEDVVARNAAT